MCSGHMNMVTYLKPMNTLRQLLSAPKDPSKYEQVSGVVYNIYCEVGGYGEKCCRIDSRDRQDPQS